MQYVYRTEHSRTDDQDLGRNLTFSFWTGVWWKSNVKNSIHIIKIMYARCIQNTYHT